MSCRAKSLSLDVGVVIGRKFVVIITLNWRWWWLVVVLCKKQDTDIFYSSFSSFQIQSRYFSLSRCANKKQQAKETSKGRSLCLSSRAEHYKMVMTINRQLLNCSPSTQWGREFLSSSQLLRNCFFLFCNKRRHTTGSFGEKNGLK